MIKCIASDMDGTLINASHEISQSTKDAILLAQGHGIEFLVATGRSWEEARFVLDKAGVDCPAICVNGAEIRDKNGKVLQSIGMNGTVSEEIAQIFQAADIYFELYTPAGNFTKDVQRGIDAIVDIYHTADPTENIEEIRQSIQETFSKRSINIVDDYGEIFNADDCSIYKFLAFCKDEQLLKKTSRQLEKIAGIHVTSSGRHNIELTHADAQKGKALKWFAEQSGISLSETMALGDNYNDLSMLEIAGYSVAMGNAEQEVKEVCRYETTTNDNDGVAKAIMKALS